MGQVVPSATANPSGVGDLEPLNPRAVLARLRELGLSAIGTMNEREIVGTIVQHIGLEFTLPCALLLLNETHFTLASASLLSPARLESLTEMPPLRDSPTVWGRSVREKTPVTSSGLDDIHDGEWLVLPLVGRSTDIGAFGFCSAALASADAATIAAFGTFAGEAALVIENARLYDQAQRRLARMRHAHDIFVLMHSSLELEAILAMALRGLQQLTTCSWAAVYLLDRDAGLIRSMQATPDAPVGIADSGWPLAEAEDAAHPLASLLQAEHAQLLAGESEELAALGSSPLLGPGIRGIVALRGIDGPSGLLVTAWNHGHEPEDEDLEYVNLVAEEAAVAVANAQRLHAARLMATVDPLTGLANLRYLNDRLRAELSRARRTRQPLTVMMIDVNDFKRFNDAHGHLVGNRALRTAASVLQRCCRSSDIVGRYGGDEFMVILPDTDSAAATIVLRRIQEQVVGQRIHLRRGGPITVTLSCGLATYPVDANGERELLKRADAAMYLSKRTWKDGPLR